MSRPRTSWKAQTLALDPKATLTKNDAGLWQVQDAAGVLIGWSERPGESSMMCWMRAFYTLEGRKVRAP